MKQDDRQKWFQERYWSLSGMRDCVDMEPRTTHAKEIYYPTTTEEIAAIVKDTHTKPISCVCGGHESSNAALVANQDAIVLDFSGMTTISIKDSIVTVQAGTLTQDLVETVHDAGGALPIGTGYSVGVVGYLINGGLSGYFSRRLGLLAQRVTNLTLVDARGEVHQLSPTDGERFSNMLGGGSALGIITEVSFKMAKESILQCAKQIVLGYQDRSQAVAYSRQVLDFMRDHVMPNDSVSMEMVVSANKAVVMTLVFYDTFQGSVEDDYVETLQEMAKNHDLAVLATESDWSTWYEVASALWPIIRGLKGDPLCMIQHACGTKTSPTDEVFDYMSSTWIGEAPLDEAEMTIVEARTLGGAIADGPMLPTGNCVNEFFVDAIVTYDASGKTSEERKAIRARVQSILKKGREVPGLVMDFSGTHSQADDIAYPPKPEEIFASRERYESLKRSKESMDPHNRFRFHPFAGFL